MLTSVAPHRSKSAVRDAFAALRRRGYSPQRLAKLLQCSPESVAEYAEGRRLLVAVQKEQLESSADASFAQLVVEGMRLKHRGNPEALALLDNTEKLFAAFRHALSPARKKPASASLLRSKRSVGPTRLAGS